MNILIKLRDTILTNLPKGFVEQLKLRYDWLCGSSRHLPWWLSLRPKTSLAVCKYCISKKLYRFLPYGNLCKPGMLEWFVKEYPKHSDAKLDMGKSCVRFKKMDKIPYDLIGKLMRKMSVNDWIKLYEKSIKK